MGFDRYAKVAEGKCHVRDFARENGRAGRRQGRLHHCKYFTQDTPLKKIDKLNGGDAGLRSNYLVSERNKW
jgi:hypothetical protein